MSARRHFEVENSVWVQSECWARVEKCFIRSSPFTLISKVHVWCPQDFSLLYLHLLIANSVCISLFVCHCSDHQFFLHPHEGKLARRFLDFNLQWQLGIQLLADGLEGSTLTMPDMCMSPLLSMFSLVQATFPKSQLNFYLKGQWIFLPMYFLVLSFCELFVFGGCPRNTPAQKNLNILNTFMEYESPLRCYSFRNSRMDEQQRCEFVFIENFYSTYIFQQKGNIQE